MGELCGGPGRASSDGVGEAPGGEWCASPIEGKSASAHVTGGARNAMTRRSAWGGRVKSQIGVCPRRGRAGSMTGVCGDGESEESEEGGVGGGHVGR